MGDRTVRNALALDRVREHPLEQRELAVERRLARRLASTRLLVEPLPPVLLHVDPRERHRVALTEVPEHVLGAAAIGGVRGVVAPRDGLVLGPELLHREHNPMPATEVGVVEDLLERLRLESPRLVLRGDLPLPEPDLPPARKLCGEVHHPRRLPSWCCVLLDAHDSLPFRAGGRHAQGLSGPGFVRPGTSPDRRAGRASRVHRAARAGSRSDGRPGRRPSASSSAETTPPRQRRRWDASDRAARGAWPGARRPISERERRANPGDTRRGERTLHLRMGFGISDLLQGLRELLETLFTHGEPFRPYSECTRSRANPADGVCPCCATTTTTTSSTLTRCFCCFGFAGLFLQPLPMRPLRTHARIDLIGIR